MTTFNLGNHNRESTEDNLSDNDALSAHLDRGWDLLQQGELSGARVSASHVLKLDADSAEGYLLLGCISAADGDPEDALDFFEQALDADPEHLEVLLHAAELAVEPVGDYERALKWCAEAEDLVESDDELVDLLLVKAEALVGMSEHERAGGVLAGLPQDSWPSTAHRLRGARLYLELDQPDLALKVLEPGLDDPSVAIDAHYFSGIAASLAGQTRQARDHFLVVYEHDLRLPPVERWEDAYLARIVEQAVAELPEACRDQLDGISLHVISRPSLELIVEGFDPRVPLFLAGKSTDGGLVPSMNGKANRSSSKKQDFPTARGELYGIFVYRQNLERLVGPSAEIEEPLGGLVQQEIRLFLGIDV